jgi:hypothetical protein
MKRFPFFIWLAVLLLLIPAGVSASTYLFVYSTPPGAAIYLNDTYLGGVTPREQNAMPGVYKLVLQKSGYPDYTKIVTITEGSTVIVDYDFQNAAPGKSGTPPTIRSITPSSGATDTTVSITGLTGTNFASNAFILLQRSGNSPIPGSVTSVNSAGTKIVGTFDLSDQAPGDYQVCVYNDAFMYVCGLTFTITRPDTVTARAADSNAGTGSSIYFYTNPPGATVYLDTIEIGTSAFTFSDVSPGTHEVLIRKTGYNDYTGSVTVPAEKHVMFEAQMTPLGGDTTVSATAAMDGVGVTAIPVRTVTRSARNAPLNVPTTWPGEIPSEASPVDPLGIIGAAGLCLGIAALRKR